MFIYPPRNHSLETPKAPGMVFFFPTIGTCVGFLFGHCMYSSETVLQDVNSNWESDPGIAENCLVGSFELQESNSRFVWQGGFQNVGIVSPQSG